MIYLFITLLVIVPVIAFAATSDSPLELYTLWTYLWVLGMSLLGGIASFYAKMKSGHVRFFNFMELIGELFTSAFAGVITFQFCEWAGLDQMLTAAFVGLAGHGGSRAIFLLEKIAQGMAEKRLQINIGMAPVTESETEKENENQNRPAL